MRRSGLMLLAIPAFWSAPDAGVAADWPQFHGLRRDGVSEETGLLKAWPAGGPRLLWSASGLGDGFSSAAVADGRIYVTGNVGPDTAVRALGLDGQLLWTAKNGPADAHPYPGARSTPTINEGCLYHEGSDGDVACFDAKTGERRWARNILAAFGGKAPKWGLAESPLVDGARLICVPGGTNAGVVALDKLTGATRWASAGSPEKAGYASPVAIEFGGVRQIVTLMERSVVGVRADSGELLWRVPHRAYADETVSTPLFNGRCVFVSTLPPGGTQCLALSLEGGAVRARQAWQSGALDNHHGGVVLVGGHLYGSNLRGKWVCLEQETGRVAYAADGVGKGALVCADGMLIAVSEKDGTVGLVKASPAEHAVISRFRLPEGGRGPVWAHPAVSGGRLYLRHGDRLYCYDLRPRG